MRDGFGREKVRYPAEDPVVQAYTRQYFHAISDLGVTLTERQRFGYMLDGLAKFLPEEQVREIEADCQAQLIQGA
ncbi:MAG: hypothetical protein UW68_C0046G0009 [Candidatus Collierbacteria bacterium GW2011_GWB1_44_6]|uniref:Uncharacterized protein n=2 Tax=Candidatus Collieribacteriota TaxID=1752725 RepID=A0A0G1JKU7_9BACT|nr:MAG: hypothetical protein UV68_C0053G0008 [Candidatus Collierbacteria bacterium GW2011_GWC2_43_12]KKT72161.1 MAG: hypothetical protein UW68_C0046G0009 [Candidatus Collierbacteria bacterium GW2011_GWB1_44_6]